MNGTERPVPAYCRVAMAWRHGRAAALDQYATAIRKGSLCGWRGYVLLALFGVSGCQAPAAPFDPFLAGRNTIPPPGTAAPAAAAPYYNGAPPTVVTPAPSTIYAPPGATPAVVPAVAAPPAGSGRFPRGISLPQSNNRTRTDSAQLAAWQPAGYSSEAVGAAATTRAAAATQTATAPRNWAAIQARAEAPGDRENSSRIAAAAADGSGNGDGDDRTPQASDSGVVRASYDEPSREPPIRIVAPLAKSKPTSNPAKKRSALPELTDFPPADERR